jgi:hypothetical protein
LGSAAAFHLACLQGKGRAFTHTAAGDFFGALPEGEKAAAADMASAALSAVMPLFSKLYSATIAATAL